MSGKEKKSSALKAAEAELQRMAHIPDATVDDFLPSGTPTKDEYKVLLAAYEGLKAMRENAALNAENESLRARVEELEAENCGLQQTVDIYSEQMEHWKG